MMEMIKDDEDEQPSNESSEAHRREDQIVTCIAKTSSSLPSKKFVRSNSEKRVEFSVGPAKNLNMIGKSRPKSALKRFNIDTHRQVFLFV